MFKLFVVFAALVAVCYGYAIQTRSTSSNLYYVYTRTNPYSPVPVLPEANSINTSPIQDSATTVILVHGHSGSAFSSLNPIVREALLTAANVNVIVVDWSLYASLSYSVAAGTVPAVATELAEFIELLVTANKIQLTNLHLVGFNLGAHVVGIAARSLTSGTVARITGLDPSGNQWGSGSQRLRVTDATYVEVLHTDGSGILANGLGTAIGRVDFFANGGSSQPGCFSNSCCHERAYELFAASMINPTLIGYGCSTNTQLVLNLCRGFPLKMGGIELTKYGSGTYRINTGRIFPF